MRVCPTCFSLFGPDQMVCPKDSSPTESHIDVLIGKNLGAYVVRSLIGEGGMGVVYAGEHPTLGKRVALKVLRPELSLRDDIVERFVQEARAVNTIGHSNIVNIYDFGRTPYGSFYIVMEYLDGVTLRSLIERAGPQPLERVRAVVSGIGAALAAAHGKGFIHRDIKPENIVVVSRGPQESVKLLDFGIVKLLTADRRNTTMTGTTMGTPQYMCPEQLEDSAVDHRADIFALGAVTYEMLTGVVPFPGKTQAEVRQLQLTRMPPPPSVARTESRLSRALDAAVLWALTLDPAARCKRIEDFLSAFQVGYDRTLVEQMHPQEARRPGSRRVVLVVAAAVTLLGGAAAVGYVATRDPGAVAPPPRHGTAAAPNSPPDAAAPLSAKEARAEARRQLEEALRSTDALLKQSALEYLRRVARQPGPAVVARVREAIQDANPLTAINAIRAAGELGDKEAIPELSALLAQSIGPKRIATAEALAQLGHKAGVEQLRKEVSSDGLFARARQGDIEARGGLKRMLASLDSIGADPGQRVTSASYRALGYLTSLGDAKATEAFERVLRGASCEAIVEMAQALLLATPDRKDVREALVRCLDEGGGKGRSRLKAALQLAQIRDARAVDPLVQFVESSQELELRRDAILGLGRVGGERARSAVVTSLKSPDALTRLAAAVALFEP